MKVLVLGILYNWQFSLMFDFWPDRAYPFVGMAMNVFIQLLKLHGEDDSRVLGWIGRKSDKYTSSDIQNEMLRVMALQVLREVATNLHSTEFYTMILDETTDTSNREQVVICI